MTAKKLIVALALIGGATSAAMAKAPRYYDSAGAQSGGNGAVFEDAQHGGGAETQR